jgi:hypothetical protein
LCYNCGLYKLEFGFSNEHVDRNYCLQQNTVWKCTSFYKGFGYKKNILILLVFLEAKDWSKNMCGAIDATHIILVEKPLMNLSPANYWNQHDHLLVLLRGVCDANLLFWDVCIRAPEGTHDATHFLGFIFVQGFFREIYFVINKQPTRLSASSTLHCRL